jgi:putative hydrolase of HD superfamily
MEPKEYLDILHQAAKLKTQTRHNWTQPDRKESVADHSWRITLMAMLLSGEEEFRDTDMNRVIRMCLIHDLGESFTGDIPSFEKTDGDTRKEDRIFEDWVDGFPEPQRSEWKGLLSEMEALETREAKTYKALDKLEAVISHDEADLESWLPLEYELQLSYGRENVAFSPYLTRLKEAVDGMTREKIRRESNHSV